MAIFLSYVYGESHEASREGNNTSTLVASEGERKLVKRVRRSRLAVVTSDRAIIDKKILIW